MKKGLSPCVNLRHCRIVAFDKCPDEKGIKPSRAAGSVKKDSFDKCPDEKGIKPVNHGPGIGRVLPSTNALMKKGLSRAFVNQASTQHVFDKCPDEKGIKPGIRRVNAELDRLRQMP